MQIAGRAGLRGAFAMAAVLMLLAMPGAAQDTNSEAAAIEEATEKASVGNRSAAAPAKECRPGFGCVTNLPLPRYVSLKGDEGNARRGPGLTHRVDWVFTRRGMPLRVTAEYENWRRVEDQDGAGGWMHYAGLSGVRSALIMLDMAELRASPDASARVVAQAEMGVVARILECSADWCRLSAGGERGWIEKTALWGVDPGEIVK